MRSRKVSRVHQDFIDIIHQIANIVGIRDIEYLIHFGCDDIDCFLGGIHKVQIKGVRDGLKIKHSVIIKWHRNPSDRVCFREYYHREYMFYQHIAPSLLDIQRKFKVIEGLKLKIPNCILASREHDKEIIVVQDLNDFRQLDRFHKMDFAHASLVLKNLAKIHALSFALATLNPNSFQDLRRECAKDVQYSDPENIPTSLIWYFKTSVNVVTDSDAREKLLALAPHVLLLLHKCTTPTDQYSTFCHSDCWTNNIIFKYQGRRPVEALLVDFQLARYAPPVTDVSYFLYMSTHPEFLSEYYEFLLKIYYGTLSAVLRECNLDVEDIYPKSVFLKQLKDYSVLGLIEALISMKIITAEPEEALEMTEMKYHYSEELCQYKSQNQSLYVKRVNDVVNDFFSRGFSLTALLDD